MKTTAKLCLVILLLMITTLEARHHRDHHHKHHRKRDQHVHIEIYYPKGMLVWYPKQQEMAGFGIEIFLNQKHSVDTPKCDICLNTTESTYGKFMIRNDNAIIRAGDHLKYRVIKHMVNGSIHAMKSNEFYVADYRLLPQLDGCSSSLSTSGTTKDPTSPGLKAEINLLESIIYDIFQHCNNVTQPSKNLFLHSHPEKPLLDSKALYNRTLQMLKKNIPSIDWDKKLMHAFYYENGVGFEVKTMIDKLKVLYLSKNMIQPNPYVISDLDELGNADHENESGEGYELSVSDIRMSN